LNARFYIDPETGLPHIHNHQVEEAEVIDVLEKTGRGSGGPRAFEDWPTNWQANPWWRIAGAERKNTS